MNIIRELHDFGVNPETGYKVVFVTKIENWAEPLCNTTVSLRPNSFE